MPLMWNKSLETGIRELDLQHQELLEIANELERCVNDDNPHRAWQEVLPRLSGYALFHFATEENLLIGLPSVAKELAAHIAEHRTFATKVEALRASAPDLDGLREFIDYLQKWLVAHIGHSDQALVALVSAAHRTCKNRTA